MKIFGPKRYTAIRAIVYAATVVLVIAVPFSIWLPQSIVIQHSTGPKSDRIVILELADTRLSFEQSPVLPSTGSKRFEVQRIGAAILSINVGWWSPPEFARFPAPAVTTTTITPMRGGVPLVYVLAILCGLSGWFIFNRIKVFPAGHCPVCGYNLANIDTPTCPECGEAHA